MRFSTAREVLHLKPAEGQKRTDYYHSNESGFICRVSKNSKSWMISHTVKANGRTRRRKVTIGRYPDISLVDAIDEARKIKADARTLGHDMLGVREAYKSAPTVEDVMNHYFKETSMTTKTLKESKQATVRDVIPTLGDLKAIDLTRQNVKDLHRRIVKRKAPVSANRTVELLRRAFNCAYEEELIERNPYPNLKKIKAKEVPRDRILKDSEIKALWNALDDESDNMKDIMRLLLLLGQRSMETMSMAVTDVDVDRREWTVPAARTKNGKTNVLPLTGTAWGIIKPRLKNDKWVFPASKGHKRCTKDVRNSLKASTGIKGWVTHDLRRTCRTIMSREGVPPHVAEQVLGHVQSGVEGIYDQHSYLKEKQKALEKVDRAICKILGISTGIGKVIQMRKQV